MHARKNTLANAEANIGREIDARVPVDFNRSRSGRGMAASSLR